MTSRITSTSRQADNLGTRFIDFLLKYGAYIIFVLVFAYFSINSPVFLSLDNMIRILLQVSSLAIVSFGMSAVIMGGGTHVIKGGIDLSVGAQIGLITGVYTVLMQNEHSVPLSIAAGILVGLFFGLLNGIAVEYLKILPLLATLAIQLVVIGAELLVTNNLIISVNNPFIRFIADESFLGMPIPVVILVITFLFYWLLLHKMPIGLRIQAVGGNREAALRAGLPVRRLTILTYLLASLAAAISSIIIIGRLSGSTRGIGALMLLDILLTSYVSAMFSKKWAINIPGTLLGAMFVGILTNGFTMINVPTYWVHAIKGTLILFVVSATSLQQKRSTEK